MKQASLWRRATAAAGAFGAGVSASVRLAARVAQGGTHFLGASRQGTLMKFWRASLSSADREYLGDRATLVSRQRDLARNDTAVASAKRRRVSSAVGNGWQLVAEVDGEALGLTPEDTEALNASIERAWRAYAFGHTFEMDAQRQLTFGGLLRTAAAAWFVDGEAFAHVGYSPGEPCATWSTRLELVDTDRVSNPANTQDTDLLRAGVELDAATRAPIAYHVRERHPADVGVESIQAKWRRIERWTPWGRPNFLHIYDRERPGQTRGVSQLAAALHALRALEKFSKATVENAILNALLLGQVKSNAGPKAVSENFTVEDALKFEDARADIYGGNSVNITDEVSIPVFPHGDEMEIFTQVRDVASFEGFTRTILRRVAASLGTTYEELAMDYSTTNYSSARAAMIHAYAETLALQTLLRDQLVQPFYVAWLEEAVETGRIALPASAPDYWQNLGAYTRCRWIAPGKGYIDATKEIQAEAMEIENGFDTLADICARNGKNWRDVLRQRKRELAAMAAEGLTPPESGVTLAAASAPQIVAAPDANPVPAQAA